MTRARKDKRFGRRPYSSQQSRAFPYTGERDLHIPLVAAKQDGRAVQLPVMIEQLGRRP